MNLLRIIFNVMLVFYACAIMYLLLDVQWKNLSRKKKIGSIVYFIALLIFDISAQIVLDYSIYGKLYLLFTQIPVFLLFLMISKFQGIKLIFVLLTTVFFSAPVMVLRSFFQSFSISLVCIALVFNSVLVFLIDRYFKKPFNYVLTYGDNRMFLLFSMIPLLYYIYSYASTRYQFDDIVLSQHFFIEQIPWIIALFSYFLLTRIFQMVSKEAEMKNAQNLAIAQLSAATKEIEQLRITEQQSVIYRHDLRHHMNYLNACILDNKLEEALAYIQQTCSSVENMKIERYSENEPINLILSSYIEKAKEIGIDIHVHVTAVDFSRFLIIDLCSLLANALENAIEASSQAENDNLRYINLRMYEKSNKLCLDLRNGYVIEPVFENGIPVSHKKEHGIGVISMIHVIEKYEGVFRFWTEEGEFRFQISM